MPFVLRRKCDPVIITSLSNHATEKYPQQRSQEPIQSLFLPSQYLPSNEGGDGHLLDLGSSAILLSIIVGGNTDYLINLGHDPPFWPSGPFLRSGLFLQLLSNLSKIHILTTNKSIHRFKTSNPPTCGFLLNYHTHASHLG